MGQLIFKKGLPHIIALFVIFLLNLAFFYPQLEGKMVKAGDIVSYSSAAKELHDLQKNGDNAQWTNSMFGGMPAYQISPNFKGNKIGVLESIQRLWMSRPMGYFIALMLGFYIAMVLLGVNTWLSLIGAIAFGFSANHLVLFEAGHMTKIRVIAQFAPIIAGVLLVFKKRYILGGVLFALGMAIGIYANHIQMMYYLGLILIIYVLFEIIQHLKNKQLPELLKAGGALTIGLLLGVGSSAANLLTTYEYSKDTMRGEPILTVAANKAVTSSSEVAGLEYGYAMQWSNGFLDVMASMIPGVVGGGSGESISPTSATALAMRKKGAQVDQAPLYWGPLPVTSGPVYIGSIMCFLFILGLLIVKGPVKWWLGIGVLLTFLLSMGKNFDVLTRLFFDFVPMYSKFRAPSSFTSVATVLIPILGILGLSQIIQEKANKTAILKSLYIATGIAGAIALFFALLGPSMFDMSSPGDARYQQGGWDVAAIVSDRKSLMRSDAFRAFLLIALTSGLIWAYLNDKIKQIVLIGGLGALVLFDMWSVGKRYLGADKFITPKRVNEDFQLRPVDQQIYAAEKIDANNLTANPVGRGGYRVLDMSIDVFNSSQTSYHHNTVGGYHAAKLQRIMDLIDYYISKGNQAVLDMLNTKYFISREGQLQQNPGAAGTAWFVESVRKVDTPNAEIEALGSFNPTNEAIILDAEFDNYIAAFDPQKNGSITLTNYKPHHLQYTTSSTSEQLAVFSEIWYGPDKGWQAYVDGNPVSHIRANYALRAMKVPSGQHQIEFKFEPSTYYMGENISLASSLLLLLALLSLIGYSVYNYINSEKIAEPKVVQRAVKATLTPTTSKKAVKSKRKKKPKK